MKKIIIILLPLMIAAGCGSYAKKRASYYYSQNLYEEAKKLFDKGSYYESISKADMIINIKEKSVPYLPAALFLKAESYMELAKKLKNPVEYNYILEQFRKKEHASSYTRLYGLAVFNLGTLLSIAPEDKLVPKAFLTIARIYDVDGLNDMNRAIQFYSETKKRFPGTEEGKSARSRLTDLYNANRGMGGASHGVQN